MDMKLQMQQSKKPQVNNWEALTPASDTADDNVTVAPPGGRGGGGRRAGGRGGLACGGRDAKTLSGAACTYGRRQQRGAQITRNMRSGRR